VINKVVGSIYDKDKKYQVICPICPNINR